MHTTRHRSLAAGAAGALLLAALAGCGSADKTSKVDAKTAPTTSASGIPSPTDTASPASGAAATADGTPAAPGERLTKDNLVATMLAAMRDKKTAHMKMEIGSSINADADVRYGTGGPGSGTDMRMSMDMGPTKAQVIMVGGTMYMQQSAGAKYVKIDSSDPAMGSLLNQMSSFGPESSVAAMRGAVQDVQYAGSATVDGQKVDKYKVTVDSSAIAKTLGTTAGTADLPKTLTYVLYVDGNHLMRRIEMNVVKQDITMTVSDWGKPVDIKAPPASQLLSH